MLHVGSQMPGIRAILSSVVSCRSKWCDLVESTKAWKDPSTDFLDHKDVHQTLIEISSKPLDNNDKLQE